MFYFRTFKALSAFALERVVEVGARRIVLARLRCTLVNVEVTNIAWGIVKYMYMYNIV